MSLVEINTGLMTGEVTDAVVRVLHILHETNNHQEKKKQVSGMWVVYMCF